MKVFWSWQSDTEGDTGRYFVRDALKVAVQNLKQSDEILEPSEREALEAMHIDQDTEDLPGSPNLADEILKKIDKARVVVADVTAITGISERVDTNGRTRSKKKFINSNVAIELGYALKAHSSERLLLVLNEYYGEVTELPFDLRHRGGSIRFRLPPDASKDQIKSEGKKLVAAFVQKLRPYLSVPATDAPLEETPTVINRSRFFQKADVLAEQMNGHGRTEFVSPRMSLAYLRLIPTRLLTSEVRPPVLLKLAQQAPCLSRAHGVGPRMLNRWGAISGLPMSPASSENRQELEAFTQFFANGEIWSVGTSMILTEAGGRPADIPCPIIPIAVFEVTYHTVLHALRLLAGEHIVRGAWQVEAGLSGIFGCRLATSLGGYLDPIPVPEVSLRRMVKGDDHRAADEFLDQFFTKVFEASGQERPEHSGTFPLTRSYSF